MSDNVIHIDKEIFGDLAKTDTNTQDKDPLGINLLSGAEKPVELNLDDLMKDASAPTPAPAPAPATGPSPKATITIPSVPGIKPIGEINKDAQSSVKPGTPQEPARSSWFSGMTFGNTAPVPPATEPTKTQAELVREKNRLLAKLNILERRGVSLSRTFDASSDIEELRAEYDRIKETRAIENGIRWQRQVLMAAVTTLEYTNNTFDPFDIELEGWSETVHESIDDYDDIFEELYEKYRGRGNIAPEIRLLLSVGGSALMFHLAKTKLANEIPGLGDIMRQNPEIARQVAGVAAKAVSGGMAKNEPSSGGGIFGMLGSLMGGNKGRSAPAPMRTEMQGPGEISEILRELDTASVDAQSRSGSVPRRTGPASHARSVSVVKEGGDNMRVSVERSDANTLVLDV